MSQRAAVLASVRWMTLTRAAGQAVTWAITVIVIRLLSPDDYGLMASAALFVGFATTVRELGLNAVIIQRRDIGDDILRKFFGILLLSHLLLFLALFLGAGLLAAAIGDARVAEVIRVLSLVMLISAFATIPEALLSKRMDFRAVGLITLVGLVLGSVVTLTVAWRGYGVWALVAGNIATAAISTIGFCLASPFRHWPSFAFRGLGEALGFGGRVTATGVFHYLYTHADVFIVGRVLGSISLGYYTVAFHIASLPLTKVEGIIGAVAFPAFSRSQHDMTQVRRYFLYSTGINAFVFFPICWGFSSVADDFVPLILGGQWLPAVILLQIIALGVPLRMLGFGGPALTAIGRPDIVMRAVATNCVVVPACLLVGAYWGLTGVALGWLVGAPLAQFVNLRRALPVLGVSFRQYGAELLPTVASALFMYGAVWALKTVMPADAGAVARLGSAVGVGIAAYAAAAYAINRAKYQEALVLALGMARKA